MGRTVIISSQLDPITISSSSPPSSSPPSSSPSPSSYMLAAGGAGGGGCTHHLWLAPDDDYVSMRRRMMIRKSVNYIYFCPFIIIIISFVRREDMMHTLRSWVAFLPLFGPFSVKNLLPHTFTFNTKTFKAFCQHVP